MKNKQLTTLDISHSKAAEYDVFPIFMHKLNELCHIRYLTMENLQPEISNVMPDLGATLAANTKVEVLILRENKIKWNAY